MYILLKKTSKPRIYTLMYLRKIIILTYIHLNNKFLQLLQININLLCEEIFVLWLNSINLYKLFLHKNLKIK